MVDVGLEILVLVDWICFCVIFDCWFFCMCIVMFGLGLCDVLICLWID